jgi:hypothetical protein
MTSRNSKDQNTLLKLVNKYAESYNILEEENKELKIQIKDLKENLKINKEIIEGMFITNKNSVNHMYIEKLKEENQKLTVMMEKAHIEREDAKNKYTIIENYINEMKLKENDELEKIRQKLFVVENAIIKKDNIIELLKRKLAQLNELPFNKNSTKKEEVYIIEPSKAVTQIHEELQVYKEIFKKLSAESKSNKEHISKYSSQINDLLNSNYKLKTRIKEYKRSNSNIETINNRTLVQSKSPKHKNPNYITEEWIDIMRTNGITQEDLTYLSKNIRTAKFMEAVEMLNKLVQDKSIQIKLLEEANNELYKENVMTTERNYETYKNTSKINNRKRESIEKTKFKTEENSSGHDSIIYMKEIVNNGRNSHIGTNGATKFRQDEINTSFAENQNNEEQNGEPQKNRVNTLESFTTSEFNKGINDNDNFHSRQNESTIIDQLAYLGNVNIKTDNN